MVPFYSSWKHHKTDVWFPDVFTGGIIRGNIEKKLVWKIHQKIPGYKSKDYFFLFQTAYISKDQNGKSSLIVQVHPKTERDHSYSLQLYSKHFIDKEPTYEHPYPTEELGYDPSHLLSTFAESSLLHSWRKLLYTPSSSRKNLPSTKNTLVNGMTESEIIENPFQSPCNSADQIIKEHHAPLVPSQHIVQSIVKTMTCQ